MSSSSSRPRCVWRGKPASFALTGIGGKVSATGRSGDPAQGWFYEAVAALGAGRAQEAVRLFDQVLRSHPALVPALTNKAVALVTLGQREAALACLDQALRHAPSHALAWSNRAVVLCGLGQAQEALRSAQRALQLAPATPEALLARGQAQGLLGNYAAALQDLSQGLAGDPGNADALYERGKAYFGLGQPAQALEDFAAAQRLAPRRPDILQSQGLAQLQLQQYAKAERSFSEALQIAPESANMLNNRGMARIELERQVDAMADFSAALSLRPDHLQAMTNLGVSHLRQQQFLEGTRVLEEVIARWPDYAPAHRLLSSALLIQGDFVRGWEEYEWRRKDATIPSSDRPGIRWDGSQDLKERSILVYAEQGLGDTLHFCRYVILLAQRGARVHLEAQAPLETLLAGLEGLEAFHSAGRATPPHCDFQCPLESLARAFRTRCEDIPAPVPYVYPRAGLVEAWRTRLGASARKRVGLVWSGNSAFKADHHRSVPLSLFAPLWSLAWDWVALMKDVRDADREAMALAPLQDHGAALIDFAQTAACIACLDLVITVDTSVAHLAGAMGKPVWILLPFYPDWRWLLDREDSPWYPSARLFRQSAPGDWVGVLARVKAALDQASST